MIPIANYEDKYLISSNGEIFSIYSDCVLKPVTNSNGYRKVTLTDGAGGTKDVSIHRLVALHFLPNPYQHTQVNHKDGDKSNNTVGNLEWCSATGNIQHALKTNLRPGYMSLAEKDELVQRVISGEMIKDISKEIGRKQESLAGMLRKRAKDTGLSKCWADAIKRGRSERTTIRNKI